MIKYLEVGKIVNTHGIKGEVKVMPLTDDPERFKLLKWVYVDKDSKLIKYDIEGVKFFKQWVFLKLKGVNTPEEAEKLKELFLKVDRENAVRLPKDHFFICDLIGMLVLDHEGNQLGELKDVLKTGSNDVFVVKGASGREILIPALKSVVQEVNLEENRMVVTLPEGLMDDEI